MTDTTPPTAALLEMRGISKGFPGVQALDGVDFANSLSDLPIAPLQETSKIREGCARKNPRANSLIVRGKGGVAARPDAFLPLYDLRLEPADEL